MTRPGKTASRRRAAALAVIACVAACAGEPPAERAASPAAVRAVAQRHLGHYVWGHEVRSFTPCGSERTSWVVDQTGGDLVAAYQALAVEPYEALFVELLGTAGPALATGFGADYDGTLTVTALRRIEREGHGCGANLDGLEFRAFGVEPFWSLEIRATGIVLTRPDPSVRLELPYQAPREDDGRIVYRAPDPRGDGMEVELVEERCVDPMAGSRFPFSALVRLSGETLRGCALQGLP